MEMPLQILYISIQSATMQRYVDTKGFQITAT